MKSRSVLHTTGTLRPKPSRSSIAALATLFVCVFTLAACGGKAPEAGDGLRELRNLMSDTNGQYFPVDDDLYIGNPNAPCSLIVFSNFNCGYCSQFFAEAYDSLLHNEVARGTLKLAWLHLIDERDSLGMLMAQLTELGRPFGIAEALRQRFFTAAPFADSLAVLQSAIGLDLPQRYLDSALAHTELLDSLKRITYRAFSLQVRGSPSYILNGQLSEGYWSYALITSTLRRLLPPQRNWWYSRLSFISPRERLTANGVKASPPTNACMPSKHNCSNECHSQNYFSKSKSQNQ